MWLEQGTYNGKGIIVTSNNEHVEHDKVHEYHEHEYQQKLYEMSRKNESHDNCLTNNISNKQI